MLLEAHYGVMAQRAPRSRKSVRPIAWAKVALNEAWHPIRMPLVRALRHSEAGRPFQSAAAPSSRTRALASCTVEPEVLTSCIRVLRVSNGWPTIAILAPAIVPPTQGFHASPIDDRSFFM